MGSGRSGLYSGTAGSHAFVPGDASFMDKSDSFVRFIAKRKDVDPKGTFDLIAHGTPDGIEITHNGNKIIVDSRTAAKLIKRLPGYHGQDIRLLSCNTGARAEGFAQNLANKLNVRVKAPNNILWANEFGQYYIAPRGSDGKADLTKRGKFITYEPGGKRK